MRFLARYQIAREVDLTTTNVQRVRIGTLYTPKLVGKEHYRATTARTTSRHTAIYVT